MKTSEQINELAAALVKARTAFAPIKKTHTANVASAKGSYKYTYATLDDVYEATTAPLCAAGVFVLHNIETAESVIGVSTRLLHQSGQFLETDPVWLPAGTTPQSVGSAITYAKRYSLSAALGVAAEEDDDGQQAAKRTPAAAPAPRVAEAPSVLPTAASLVAADIERRLITEGQRKRLYAISKEQLWGADDVKALLLRYGYDNSKAIRVSDYDALIEVLKTGAIQREPGDDDSDDRVPAPWEVA